MARHSLPPASALEPLAALQQRIHDVHALSLPDHLCEVPRLHDELRFVALDLDEHPSVLTGEEISLQINDEDHLFTEWSRLQLLDHLGTREKWFKRVTLSDQARELTRRVHTFDRQCFRRMKTYEHINLIRGLVSAGYVDIPDVDVIDALCAVMPDGEALSRHSGKSDKAFYAYTFTREDPIGIGKDALGFPGVLIKNSEVGACALIATPFFLFLRDGIVAPVSLRQQVMLRRIHRGQQQDLQAALDKALREMQAVWSPLQQKMKGLLTRTFPDEQAALDRLQTVLTTMKRTKSFINRCTTTYRAAKNATHNGLALLSAVLAACATSQLDQRYDDAEVAGYLLLHLL